MKKTWLALALLMLFSGLLLAHGEEKTGILVDVHSDRSLKNEVW